jgi:hypothetical protein
VQSAVLCSEARFSGAARAQSMGMEALKRLHAAPAAVDRSGIATPGVVTPGVVTPGVVTPVVVTPVDDHERLLRLEFENGQLRELVQHCAVHSAYGKGGYDQMNAEQKALYNAVIGRRSPASAPRLAGAATPDSRWRSCEFCGCRTNAAERVCCRRGRDTDRRNWDPPRA